MLRTRVIRDPAELSSFQRRWDDLACRAAAPYSAPAWVLSWLDHVAPRGALLRTVVVEDGDALIAVAPFFVDRGIARVTRYRLLGNTRRDILIDPRRGREASGAIAEVLSEVRPTPDVFSLESVTLAREWPASLLDAWSNGRLTRHPQYRQPAPTIDLSDASFERWISNKSRNFRQGLRKQERRLEAAGGRIRLALDDEVEPGLHELFRLHHLRWRARGGSSALNPRAERMVLHAAQRLSDTSRFRLWLAEVDDRAIAALLLISAGGETSAWLGGFDDSWARFDPALLMTLAAVRHAFSVGDRRMDLGPGDAPYKWRFADGHDVVGWDLLVRSGIRAPLARTQMLPWRTQMFLAAHLPRNAKTVAKRATRYATLRDIRLNRTGRVVSPRR